MRLGSDSERGGILLTLAPPGTRHPTMFPASLNAMISLDGRPHRELRRAPMPSFTAGHVKGLRARVAAESDRLIAAMAGRERVDFVDAARRLEVELG